MKEGETMLSRSTEELRKLKEQSKFSLEELAQRSGVSKSTIQRALNGETINMTSLEQLVNVFGLTLSEFSERTIGIAYVPMEMYAREIHTKDNWIKILFITCSILIVSLIALSIFAILK